MATSRQNSSLFPTRGSPAKKLSCHILFCMRVCKVNAEEMREVSSWEDTDLECEANSNKKKMVPKSNMKRAERVEKPAGVRKKPCISRAGY
ncbi:hypothetical protein M413DRAFT_162692 [Hebeloma cylindrosporum]|uniref:Uncharacterized protein n=1 Tax=Hebeloma cylindrosporum TaxID=76867 RepID=A0A0C3BV01_HEBCY|nr:hypothetical protein M413DRAFT_162692 [Hebeloma cylindrosporum h7]